MPDSRAHPPAAKPPAEICYLGTYDLGKPRNRIMLKGLRAAGFRVKELHREVWAGVEDKSQIRSVGSFLKYPLLLLWGSLSTSVRFVLHRPKGPIVVAYFGHLDLLAAKLLALVFRRPLVFDIFLSMYDTLVLDRRLFAKTSMAARAIRRLEYWLLKLPDAVICDTRANCDLLHRLYQVPEHRLWAVPVGCETEFFHPPENEPPPEENRQTLEVLFYGQYIPLHGVPYILDAAACLRDDPSVHFTLVGRGQEFEANKAQVAQQGLSNVTLIEWLPYAELRERIYRADIGLGIFGTSGKAERVIPNKVFQMMACGTTPIITGYTPGIAELLEDGRDAVLCEIGNGQAIANAIDRLRDPAERERLARTAQETFSRNASYQTIGQQFAHVLAETTGARSAAKLSS